MKSNENHWNSWDFLGFPLDVHRISIGTKIVKLPGRSFFHFSIGFLEIQKIHKKSKKLENPNEDPGKSNETNGNPNEDPRISFGFPWKSNEIQ